MKILCVIPSRIASTRLPRKPLLPILQKPMIQWTYENAARASCLSDVIVATDSNEIAKVITDIGGKAILTAPELATGTERCAAVAEQFPEFDVIINLQGDEPFIKPSMLESLIQPFLQGENPCMTTLAYPLAADKMQTPSVVKVITDLQQNALYFSRSPIPFYRQAQTAPVYHHVGLYAFQREFLLTYKDLTPTPLEKAESLEQLRVLEHGYKIKVCLTHEKTLDINTPDEYDAAQTFALSYSY